MILFQVAEGDGRETLHQAVVGVADELGVFIDAAHHHGAFKFSHGLFGQALGVGFVGDIFKDMRYRVDPFGIKIADMVREFRDDAGRFHADIAHDVPVGDQGAFRFLEHLFHALLGRKRFVVGDRKNLFFKIVVGVFDHGAHEGFLAGEVVVEAAFEQAAGFGNVGDGGIVVTFLAEQAERLFQDIFQVDFLLGHGLGLSLKINPKTLFIKRLFGK
jgi:hypothetical protein